MKINTSEFVTSAVEKKQYPKDRRKEFAFVGRSNVGKSSIINTLTNRRGLAKVSGTPGKTRLVNFFLINNDFYLVDLPGYGYAKIAKSEKEKWGDVIETYLTEREELKRIVLLVDSRHKPSEDDVNMLNWIRYYDYEYLVVATKSDKLKKSELKKNENLIRNTLNLDSSEPMFFFSSLNKDGKEVLTNRIFTKE